MRPTVGFLVVLMLMLACFAVLRLKPPSLVMMPGNWLVGGALLGGAVAVALRRRFSYPVGLLAAALAVLGGILSYRQVLWTLLPGHPVIWIIGGLYLALRLALNQQATHQQEIRRRERELEEGRE